MRLFITSISDSNKPLLAHFLHDYEFTHKTQTQILKENYTRKMHACSSSIPCKLFQYKQIVTAANVIKLTG